MSTKCSCTRCSVALYSFSAFLHLLRPVDINWVRPICFKVYLTVFVTLVNEEIASAYEINEIGHFILLWCHEGVNRSHAKVWEYHSAVSMAVLAFARVAFYWHICEMFSQAVVFYCAAQCCRLLPTLMSTKFRSWGAWSSHPVQLFSAVLHLLHPVDIVQSRSPLTPFYPPLMSRRSCSFARKSLGVSQCSVDGGIDICQSRWLLPSCLPAIPLKGPPGLCSLPSLLFVSHHEHRRAGKDHDLKLKASWISSSISYKMELSIMNQGLSQPYYPHVETQI